MDHGDQLAQDSLRKNPAKMITLMNTCCNLANAGLAIEKSKWRNEAIPAASILVPPALNSETPANETKPS